MEEVPRLAPGMVQSFRFLLEEEVKLFQVYSTLLDEEQKVIVKMNPERLNRLTDQRAHLHEQMLRLQDQRLDLMRRFPDGEGKKLRDLIIKHFHPKDAKPIVLLIDELRVLVKEVKTRGRSHNESLRFANGLAHNLVQLFRSVTRGVFQSYTRKGKMNESLQVNRLQAPKEGIARKA